MYEFIYFAVQNKSCERARAASARRERAAQAASAQHKAARAKPKLTSCPNQAAPDLCRSDPIHL